MKKLYFLPIMFLALVLSCKKDKTVTDIPVTDTMARDSLYYIMKDWYYWYDKPEATSVTSTTKDNYKNPSELLEAMRYTTLDRWSFVADYDEFVAQMNGTFVGHGFRIGLDNSNIARISMIYSNSPLYANGIRRGWIVKRINSKDVASILASGDPAAYTAMIGPSTAGITNLFVFQNPDNGNDVSFSSTKSTFQVNSVLMYDTLHLSTGITGHLVFDSFIEPSSAELQTAFEFFGKNNIKDLILDLRYNAGGYLYVAEELASYIAGGSNSGSLFAKLKYNDKHQDTNESSLFKIPQYLINLTRLVVITSRSTASASEAVINGIKPYLNVVTIGDKTDGKPTGMNGWAVGKKYFFWPVSFKIVNANDEGDYFDGIATAKTVVDDITHDFYDRKELCLKEAIHYLETGSISTKGGLPIVSSPQLSEKPTWMNNTFVIKK